MAYYNIEYWGVDKDDHKFHSNIKCKSKKLKNWWPLTKESKDENLNAPLKDFGFRVEKLK